ncbi:MAG: pilus assembly protein TadE [Alphaproteobacteria bacterium HGW-Alphaproteobacteria-2]|nr:MAG: pilus assembly protein TadE [Alphaproteobacteria bacterium HGW-Alphaproteobacteria-2]
MIGQVFIALARVTSLLSRLWRRETGTASVEFVIVFPAFIAFLASASESGLLLSRHVMFERGVDVAVRAIRLSSGAPVDRDAIRDTICQQAMVFPDCEANLLLEMTRIYDSDNDVWTYPATNTTCVDRTETVQPVTQFVSGQPNEIMLLRACMVVDLMFRDMWLGGALQKDASGGYQIVTASAFAVEPR